MRFYPVVSNVHHRHDGMQAYKTQHLKHRGSTVPYTGLITEAGDYCCCLTLRDYIVSHITSLEIDEN